MSSFQIIVVICSLTVLGGTMAATITLEGHVGGHVQIKCSHDFAQRNVKYFCNKACLKDKDILIKSQEGHNPVNKGRYRLFDEGKGNFIVTISGLKKSDSGTYWCGVDRVLKDTYNQVVLTVLEAPEPTSRATPRLPDQSTSEEPEKSSERRTESRTSTSTTAREFATIDTRNPPGNRQLIYISSGLATLVLISAICLFVLIKQTKQKKAAKQKAGKAQTDWKKHTNPEKDLQKPPKIPESSSANQKKPPSQSLHPDSSSTVHSSIAPHSPAALNYSTLNFASQSEDIHYSTVTFVKEPGSYAFRPDRSPVETSGPSASLYSTVASTDRSQSAEKSNDVIYSSIKK